MTVNKALDSALTTEMKRIIIGNLNKRYIVHAVNSFLLKQASLIQDMKVFTRLQKIVQCILQNGQSEKYVSK